VKRKNAYSESFNSRFWDELLNQELFTSLTEGRVPVKQYRVEYNHLRPYSSLGYLAPAVFATQQYAPASPSVASAPDGATAFDHPRQEGRDEEIMMLAALS
jgi:putative transposase